MARIKSVLTVTRVATVIVGTHSAAVAALRIAAFVDVTTVGAGVANGTAGE